MIVVEASHFMSNSSFFLGFLLLNEVVALFTINGKMTTFFNIVIDLNSYWA